VAQDWLAPAIFGGAVTITSSLLTLTVQALISRWNKARERREKLQDAGREQARIVLADIQAVRTSSLDGKYPDKLSGSFTFNSAEVKKVRDDVALVTDEVTRERVDDAFSCLMALGPAEHEMDKPRHRVERKLVSDAERIIAAYARGDEIPEDAATFIKSTNEIVEAAWDEAVENGTAWVV
jgi:hypothetical protein